MPRLTTKSVQALKDHGRYGDGDGLYLEVSHTGSKSWILRTTVQGRRRDIGLGGISWVSLAEAREKAREARKIAKDGRDPITERKAVKDAPSFEIAARTAYEHLKPGWRKGGVHVKHWISSLENHAFPVIGNKPINTIQSGDVLAVLQPIWFKVPETARRVLQRMRHVMQWAKGANLYAGENPVDAAKGSLPRHSGEARRHHPAVPYAEVPALMDSLAARQGVAALAVRFLILTAARSGEVRGARWDEIDLENAVWTVPASRMKAKKEHRVPLTAEALAVLEAVRGLDRDLVFLGQRQGRPVSDVTLLAALRRMNRDDITIHGMRSAFRDWAAGRRSALPAWLS
jgi:integrase